MDYSLTAFPGKQLTQTVSAHTDQSLNHCGGTDTLFLSFSFLFLLLFFFGFFVLFLKRTGAVGGCSVGGGELWLARVSGACLLFIEYSATEITDCLTCNTAFCCVGISIVDLIFFITLRVSLSVQSA